MATRAFTLATGGESIDPHWILLDSESSASIFVNRALLDDLQTANDPLVTVTNGGISRTSTIAYLKGYGYVWYDNNSVTNILSLAELAIKSRVTFDTESSNKSILHKSDGSTFFFKCTPNGLYYHDIRWKFFFVKDYTLTAMTFRDDYTLVSTVNTNKDNYTKR